MSFVNSQSVIDDEIIELGNDFEFIDLMNKRNCNENVIRMLDNYSELAVYQKEERGDCSTGPIKIQVINAPNIKFVSSTYKDGIKREAIIGLSKENINESIENELRCLEKYANKNNLKVVRMIKQERKIKKQFGILSVLQKLSV